MKTMMGFTKRMANKGARPTKSTKIFIDNKLKNNEAKYTRKYWGRVIVKLLWELKVYILLKKKPKEVPRINAIPEASK